MFNIVLWAISVVLCFINPLLLTIKALNNLSTHSDNHQLNYLKFLFNYWVYYIIVANIESSIVMRALDMSTMNISSVLFFSFKLWLFYGHGCLILTYYYLNNLLSRFLHSRNNQLEVFEMHYVEPFASFFLVNSVVVGKALNILHNLTGSDNILNAIVAPMNGFVYSLNHNLDNNEVKRPFVLNLALETFCSIDNQNTYNQYILTNNLLSFLVPSAPAPAPGLSNKRLRHSASHSKINKLNKILNRSVSNQPETRGFSEGFGPTYSTRVSSTPGPNRTHPTEFRSVSDTATHYNASPGRSRSGSSASTQIPISRVLEDSDIEASSRARSPKPSQLTPIHMQVSPESIDRLMGIKQRAGNIDNELPELPYPVNNSIPYAEARDL